RQADRLGGLLEAIASKAPAPASGSAAAAVVAAAAALLEKCARLSLKAWSGAGQARDSAHSLRLHAEELVEHDLHAYLAYVEAKRSGVGVDSARARTVEVPLEIVRAAAKVSELAEALASAGNPNLRADAVAGAILARGAAQVAAMLVRVNLEARPDDARLREARRLATDASARARRLDAPAHRDGRGRAPARSEGNRRR
ncbi:MAG: cyclodeaminase/cyclohydrolase family protein, partial [Candidatus Dormibacteraceae bacterium]